MCGRTACALAPDDICNASSYRGRDGKRRKPAWRDAPGDKRYYPSHNIAPGAHTPVMLSSKHYKNGEVEEGVERVIQPMKWGLVPSWHKGNPYKLEYETNNCRAEGMLTKRTYKIPLEKGNRCVILADGFFEWKRTKESKQPYYIYFPKDDQIIKTELKNVKIDDIKPDVKDIKPEVKDIKPDVKDIKPDVKDIKPDVKDIKPNVKDIKPDDVKDIKTDVKNMKVESLMVDSSRVKSEPCDIVDKEDIIKSKGTDDNFLSVDTEEEWKGNRLLTVAGVFEVWKPPDGSDELYSYSVITVDSSPAMAWIHHRMPAVLSSDEEIEEWLDFGNVPLSKAYKLIRPTESVVMHPVSSIVNNSRNKSPDCVVKIDPQKPKKSASSNFMMSWLGKTKTDKSEEPSPKRAKTQ